MSNLCELGSGQRDPRTNQLSVQCKGAPTGDDEAPDYGTIPMACALGVTAVPYQSDENGSAQGVVDEDVPGQTGVVTAAWDTRSAKIAGNAKAGDTILHSTGPQQAAQVQCKEDKRQVAIISKDSRGKTMIALMDGTNDAFQVSVAGKVFEVSRERVTISDGKGASITMQDGALHLAGTQITVGGGNAVIGYLAMLLSPVPVTTSTGGVVNPVIGGFVTG